MSRVCAADKCECDLSGCQHDGRAKPAQARFCSKKCASRAKKSRYRRRKMLGLFRARHPEARELLASTDSRTLDELHSRARPPSHRAGHDVPREYSDHLDLDDDLDDVQGDARGTFSDSMRAYEQVEQTRARYEARIRPMLSTQARNGGVKLPAIARLEAERDARVNQIMRAHWKAEAYERAAREAPTYVAGAHERQLESAALTAFAKDLGRGHRAASQTPTTGRDVHDAFYFG